MLIMLELFAIFFEVHYLKLLQRILQNFNAGGLLSRVGIFSGPLSGGLLSVHRIGGPHLKSRELRVLFNAYTLIAG